MAISHSEHSLLIDTPEGQKNMTYQLWQPVDSAPEKVVVCVHGLTRNGRDFDFLAPELASDAIVICPDVVGRGGSERMQEAALYGYPLYLQQMIQLLAFINDEYSPTQLDWVGTSMGGLIGMMLAATPAEQLPVSINRLVLNDVGYLIPYASLQRIGSYVGKLQRFNSLLDVEAYLRDIARPFGPLTDEQWHHLARYGSEADGDELILRYDPAIAQAFNDVHDDIDLSPVWSLVQQPVLLTRGKDSDLLLAETAQLMAQQSNVTLIEFAAVGHAPMFMAQDQIDSVKQFLR